ncbi:hypothetical protein IEO21_09321 [Rhodonia placenta]|uniref:Uncharacterized protein n=1 Tax=Rhodonia placenta TaxID=104341 RepID=A0A8H7NUM5_9APHY|nr:hypothetical protein IEO21_09321 [Postia placenta]
MLSRFQTPASSVPARVSCTTAVTASAVVPSSSTTRTRVFSRHSGTCLVLSLSTSGGSASSSSPLVVTLAVLSSGPRVRSASSTRYLAPLTRYPFSRRASLCRRPRSATLTLLASSTALRSSLLSARRTPRSKSALGRSTRTPW